MAAVEPFRNLDAARIASRLSEVRQQIEAACGVAGRNPDEVELLIAGKYVPQDEFPALEQAGVQLIGENRAQDLLAKVEQYSGSFIWDFIGTLQSRKVKQIAPHVRMIHSVATDSALRELGKLEAAKPQFLLEINIAGEESKAGFAPASLPEVLEACPYEPLGLMALPPHVSDPENSRSYFSQLRDLAEQHGLVKLSIGTSADFTVAVEEGATTVRLGQTIFA